eukprot:TCALIF_04027-PA protein Name:"Similar to sto-2 Stomatin-2 (Caenorhabditis elegans)" AED:0.30 eAED:0.30 QI:0/0.28/0/1/1/1/8/0/359
MYIPLLLFLADDIDVGIGICGWLLTAVSWFIVIITLPFSLCVCFKVVQEYERAVIFRLGRLLDGGSKGPGIFFVLPCIESYQKVDLRTITLDVPPQEVLTRDSVTVSVDAVVYYRVSNATVSVANVENAHHSTRLLAQTTLRNILGTKNLHEILSDRESISASMQSALDEATEPWGIKVERVEIKDVRLPVQLQRAMAAEAEAAREARAKVIAAEGEQKASRALRDAADVITTSPSAIQLRYLQVWKAMLMSDREQLGLELTINNSIRFILDEVLGAIESLSKMARFSSFHRKDARLPEQLQRAMAAEAEASREARAKVIAADGEMRASKALKEASLVIDQSPSALQLRYLQVSHKHSF